MSNYAMHITVLMFLDVYCKMATMFNKIASFEDIIYLKIQEIGLPKIAFLVKC